MWRFLAILALSIPAPTSAWAQTDTASEEQPVSRGIDAPGDRDASDEAAAAEDAEGTASDSEHSEGEGGGDAATVDAEPAPGGDAAPASAPTGSAENAAPTEPASDGPAVELPPEADPAAAPAASDPKAEEGSIYFDVMHRVMNNTKLGGYAEFHLTHTRTSGSDDGETQADFKRLVIFLGHEFTDTLHFHSELEIEHALIGEGAPGEVALEQAYINWDLLGQALSLRAGLVLVPMGITNSWHEPTTFHGVERPEVERKIIPSTWREGGLGIVGTPFEGFNYQVFVVTGLNPLGFSLASGIRGGRQGLAKANANGLAFTARVDYEPILGVAFGGSMYWGQAGSNTGDIFTPTGANMKLAVEVLGLSADAKVRWQGLEVKAVLASFQVANTPLLRTAHDAAGDPVGPEVAQHQLGVYGELAYDTLNTFETEHQLVPFVRFEYVDPVNTIKKRARTAADDANRFRDWAIGLTYKPVEQVAFKGNVILRDYGGDRPDDTLWMLGAGVTF